jgi:nicotinate phosphoribosyltransferase
MGSALLTDLYELNMAASYIRRGMTGPATFSLFIRNLPPGWRFFVACGLRRCLEFLERLEFTGEDLEYLAREHGYPDDTLQAFSDLRFTGDVWAIPEGRFMLPEEPLLEVTAPLPEAQLVETFLLNQITYMTAVASKAARCRLAAPEAAMVDFSFRRVHGGEASIGVAWATAVAGFVATSNVEAARRLGLRATGTMAHSYVEAFASEIEAFRAFAQDFPDTVILLVDTYDTHRGIANAIEVGRELEARGKKLVGIRLDSGDLAALSKEARALLDEAGMEEVRIVASGGLDEHSIAALSAAGAPIDSYGVGTKMGVVEDSPALDSVYKLVEFEGRPVAKLSTGKATLPGRKQVWRRSELDDWIGLRDETHSEGEPLLEEVMRGGLPTDERGLADARRRFEADLEALPTRLRALEGDEEPRPERTEELARLAEEVRQELTARELGET